MCFSATGLIFGMKKSKYFYKKGQIVGFKMVIGK